MNIKVTCTIAFLTGVAVGAAATWNFAKKKYEQIAQEEIDSVKEVFRRLRGESKVKATEESEVEPVEENEADKTNDHVDICEYRKVINNNSYDNDQNYEEGAPINMDRPYVIAPDEFGERAGYERFSFTYYSDGTLTDECDEPISPEDVEKLIGKEQMADKLGLYARVVVPPKSAVPYHQHVGNGEVYYFLTGEGEYNDNGVVRTVKPGDVTWTPDGSSHGVENKGDVDLTFMALIINK